MSFVHLLQEMGGRLWRSREASCTAMADLLQGRRWAQVQPHLEEVWTMALRALDDIKESVRVAATGLVRSLRSLTLRLCDPAASTAADAKEALTVSIPLLLNKGEACICRYRGSSCWCTCNSQGHALYQVKHLNLHPIQVVGLRIGKTRLSVEGCRSDQLS